MSGHHPFSKLTKEFTPERRQRINSMRNEILAEMPLTKPHQARELAQRNLTETSDSQLSQTSPAEPGQNTPQHPG